jgi:thiol:disulfide interchange protein/DsbC/DsbD-like thiol-disulfide interchange protein
MKSVSVAAIACSAWLVALTAVGQTRDGVELVRAGLLADTSAIVPGRSFEVGVILRMAEGWHTYWEFPGDSGLPTEVKWDVPEGFTVGPLRWPIPRQLVEPGDLEVYAYKGEVMLMATVIPPAKLAGEPVTLRAEASWLVCEAICIPGSAELELQLPVEQTSSPDNTEIFKTYRALLPKDSMPPFDIQWSHDGKTLTLGGLPEDAALFPLPAPDQVVGHAKAGPGQGEISIEAPLPFRGVVAAPAGNSREGWYVAYAGKGSNPAAAGPTLIEALLYGFLGGFILNLMPCVLPVISLKIFGFVRQAGDAPAKIFRHGLAFAAGIFVWFLGLGVVVVAIKAAGGQATWAFQFQNPWFNLVICSVVFVFALNLFGVFEIVLPGRAANALCEASEGSGYGGSFFQGMFATLLATPCTAPFLGTALGFAFSQPAVVIFAMFGSVAAGMASPYVLLSAKPGWMKVLPRPGAWMERVKQLMGFPLLATLIWLLSILGSQKGTAGVIWASAFFLCLAFSCWLYGTFCGPMSGKRTRTAALLGAALSAVVGGWFFIGILFSASERPANASNQAADGISWIEFSQSRLDELLDEGKGVFLDFTADWCISCKFNERTAIDRPAVREALATTGIIPMKADWTNANPEITNALKAFGRVGVPFYVIYPPGRAEEPIILPELLTESLVLEALKKAEPR